MGYPNSKFIWDDQTVKQNIPEVNSLDGKPVIMTVSSSDKGPEDFRALDRKYIERYGEISFAKHGQAQVQIARILAAGGAIYHHRIVAPDSALANLSVVGEVSQKSVQKVDASGAKLYLTPDGKETTAAEGNTPIIVNKAKVKYEAVAITDLATLIGLGDNPKEIARLVKNQVDLDNEKAFTDTTVDRDDPDDLTKMGHATIAYIKHPDLADTKVTTVVGKDGATVATVLFRAGVMANSITEFNKAAAVDVTATATAGGFTGAEIGVNTICVTYTDEAKYPAELFTLTIAEDDVTTTVDTILDKSVLKALIGTLQNTENTGYTEESWGAFQVALSAAVVALGDDKTQADVSAARVNLKYAFDSLITKEDLNAIPKKYLLFTLTDTGRGDSAKRVSITPNYQASKNATYTKYMVNVIEGTASTDTTLMFSMNPNVIDSGKNRRIDTVINGDSLQLRAVTYENSIIEFLNDIAHKADVEYDVVAESDVLFGYSRKGKTVDWIEVDKDSAALNSAYGLALKGGSNGSFGAAPMDSPDYYNEIVKTFNGTANVEIYDIDNVTIHAIFDANYPVEVKRAIESLVSFREDCFYFRDLGVGLTNIEDIAAADIDNLKSRFCASYHNSYDVFDEFTKKQITVTCMYHLAPMFVSHYNLGVNRPFAGMLHGFTFTDVIEGTVNYIPIKIPEIDQLQELYDLNINYMKYYDGVLVMDTERTSQDDDSELSYINNVLAIQEIIRLVRRRCPKIRYSFKSGDDFVDYQKDINQVLASKSGFFDGLELVYLEDMAQTDSKCFFAAIKVDCKDFIESEYFKVSVIQ